jgi:hypothetical protein
MKRARGLPACGLTLRCAFDFVVAALDPGPDSRSEAEARRC